MIQSEAIEQGAEIVLTQGAVQSNHARQTAAAAAKLGFKCHLLLENRTEGSLIVWYYLYQQESFIFSICSMQMMSAQPVVVTKILPSLTASSLVVTS